MNQSLTNETIQQVLTDLSSNKLPAEETLIQMLNKAKEIITQEPNIIKITGNVSVIGNICGQFADLNEALKHAGTPSDKLHLLFLGDIVNRMDNSVECFTKIVALKLLHPNHVTILRGKMEHNKLCELYGYNKEVEAKFKSLEVAKASYSVFDVLPLAAIVNEKIFCVHGGLSPDIKTLEDIEKIDRRQETPTAGSMTDLIWSDPIEDLAQNFDKSPRGAGQIFGKTAVEAFLKENKLSLIVRSHQMINEGYVFNHDEQVLTVFSAANYCNQCENKGAIVKISHDLTRTIIVYSASHESLEATRKAKEEKAKAENKNE